MHSRRQNRHMTIPRLSEVVLTVTSKDGCSDTARHNINIMPTPVVNAAAATDVVCLGNSTTLSAGGGAHTNGRRRRTQKAIPRRPILWQPRQ